MIKKLLFTVVGAVSFASVSFAAEDTAYCDKKCVPKLMSLLSLLSLLS